MNYLKLTILSPLLFHMYVSSWPMHLLPKDCGVVRVDQRANKSNRIINGQQARLEQFPWLAKLGERQNRRFILFFCSGALINRYYVISAAHCEENGDVIRIGDNYVDTDVDCNENGVCAPPHQDIRPKRYIFENYCRESTRNDIMLIELERPAKFNDFVQPLCVLRKPYPIERLVGSRVTVAGWGMTKPGDIESVPSKLLYVSVMVVGYKECHTTFSHAQRNTVFCVLDETPRRQRMCSGDSGGPAVISRKVNDVERYFLFGIVSFAELECGQMGALTNVSHYLDHLLQHVDKS